MFKGMPMNEQDVKDLTEKLEKKVHFSTSNDGAVTVEYNGAGTYKSFKINVPLNEIDKDTLEKDILDMIEYSKNQIQADLTELVLGFTEGSEPTADSDDDEFEEDRRDVS